MYIHTKRFLNLSPKLYLLSFECDTERYWLPVWYAFRKYLVYMVWTIKSLNTGSVEVGTGWYWVVLGQNRVVLVASMMSFQKIYGLHGLNHQIIEYMEKEKVMTDKQINKSTDRISSCRLDPFCKRGRVKKVKRLSNCQTKKKPNLVTIWSEALSRGGSRDFCVGGPGLRVVYLVSQLGRSLPLF